MGNFIGNAVTLDGDTIRVTFEGESVADGTLAHIMSINTQMDGGGEYSPLKQTTASISCLVDGAELMRLCVSEQPVSALIENVAQESILFKGYVVPNSYNQALSGINDTITIECVDCLGYAKYVNYDRGESFKVMTLADVFVRLASQIGVAEVRFADDVAIEDYSGNKFPSYERLTISDNMFYHDINPENIDDELIYEPVAMTCEEVLSMIAESLRLTWMQIGEILYLVDDVNIQRIGETGGRVFYRRTNGGAIGVGQVFSIEEEQAAGTFNISSLQSYSRVEINHEMVDSIPLQPDLFNRDHLQKTQNDVYTREVDDEENVAIVTLSSKTYETQSQLIAYKRFPKEEEAPRAYDDTWDTVLRVLHVGTEVWKILALRAEFAGAVAPSSTRGIKVDIALRATADSEEFPWQGEDFTSAVMLHMRIEQKSIDGTVRYFDANKAEWVEKLRDNSIYFHKGDRFVFGAQLNNKITSSVIPIDKNGGVISISLRTANYASWWRCLHIYKFNVELVTLDAWSRDHPNPAPKIESKGTWKLNRVQNVTLPIDNYYTLTERTLGDTDFGYKCRRIVVNGDKPIDRVWAQANRGDRLMWEIPLRDEANAYTALDAFTCDPLWTGCKVVAGYVRDVLDNTITLTLI